MERISKKFLDLLFEFLSCGFVFFFDFVSKSIQRIDVLGILSKKFLDLLFEFLSCGFVFFFGFVSKSIQRIDQLGLFSCLLGICRSFLLNGGSSSFLFSLFLFSGPGIVSSLFLIGHWLDLNRFLVIKAFGVLLGDLNIEDLVLTNETLEIVYVGLEASHGKSWWRVQRAAVTFSLTI